MALEIVAAKDLNHAFEIVSVSPRKTMKHHVVSEPEGIGRFLHDTRNELTNYTHTITNLIHTGKPNWKRIRFRQSRLFRSPSSSGLRNMVQKKTA